MATETRTEWTAATPGRGGEAAGLQTPPPRRRLPSLLTVRILALNIPALGILLGGALFLGQYREGLVAAKLEGLRTQGEIIAGALGETAAADGGGLDRELAAQLIGRMTAPTATRARLFDADGFLVADSQALGPAAREVEARDLPPPGGALEALQRWLVAVLRASPSQGPLPLYREAEQQQASDYAEVAAALSGEMGTALRSLSDGEMMVSVGIPVQRFKQVLGALMLSAGAGDIEAEVAATRLTILEVFGLALAVTVLLSLYLSGIIARPVRRLAEAARGSRGTGAQRADIPDFTARRDEIGELSGALREMTEALYERLDAIEAFAADVAHEIKNPLSSIGSAVETLARAGDDAEQRQELLAIINDDVRRLDRLISDISDASRLGAELARAERRKVDLLELARTLAEIHRATRGEDGPVVEVRTAGDGPWVVRCVEDRIGQVMRNLLANAVSFSPPRGHITVGLRQAGTNVEMSVEDEGPGVPEEKREAVFTRFYSQRPEAEPFGTHSGLGLPISRQIAEAHGGTLAVENQRGADGAVQGARFTLTLPVGEAR